MAKVVALLDGRFMLDKQQAHQYLMDKFNFPSYYGKNLDALYDLLVTYHESSDLVIMLIYPEVFFDNLGEYGQRMIETFQEASDNNPKLSFKMKKIAYFGDQVIR